MSTDKSCPACRAVMRLETKTLGFQTFECPKCAFVVIEVVKERVPEGRALPGSH